MDPILQYEELCFSEWPGLETLFYDSWIIRLAQGYTKRANSVNVPYGLGSIDLNQKVQNCEDLFRSRGLRSIFKLTQGDPTELDALLVSRGYQLVDPSQVLEKKLTQAESMPAGNWMVYPGNSPEWMDLYAGMKNLGPQDRQALKGILGLLPKASFHPVLRGHDGGVIATGTGVVQGPFLGVQNIIVDPAHRRQGHGRRMVQALTAQGQALGAQVIFLQVVGSNTPALELYRSLGFRKVYDYWYRVKE